MYIGIDIGGTKTAVVLADESGAIKKKIRFATEGCGATLDRILASVEELMPAKAIGVSCGGPLDQGMGIIQSPPNLPGWDNVPIVSMLEERFHIPAYLVNDANACALAEWKFGAGMGTNNMVFLTFGTGLGAGLILDGRLYNGANGNAGEVGHIRLDRFGPVGYGKEGSFEGFCSGGGLAQIGQTLARRQLQLGAPAAFCPDKAALNRIDAKLLQTYADQGDPTALEAYRVCGRMLGHGLSILIDVLNPEAIVIGSVFTHAEHLLREEMQKVIDEEALPGSAKICRVLPSGLGKNVGDYAAIAIAMTGGRGGI